jgi:hypothetical protein
MRTLVLAYCMIDLRKIDFDSFGATQVYIYSRCNQVPNYRGSGKVVVINSTQTGSCDFEYAKHIGTYGIDGPTLFIKDTFRDVHQKGARIRPIKNLVAEGYSKGFACALFWDKFNSSIVWHDRNIREFSMKKYKSKDIHSTFSNIGAWWDAHPNLVSHHTNSYVPACYGGTFMVDTHLTVPNVFGSIDLRNKETNHFMERTWARMFVNNGFKHYCRSLIPVRSGSSLRGAHACLWSKD